MSKATQYCQAFWCFSRRLFVADTCDPSAVWPECPAGEICRSSVCAQGILLSAPLENRLAGIPLQFSCLFQNCFRAKCLEIVLQALVVLLACFRCPMYILQKLHSGRRRLQGRILPAITLHIFWELRPWTNLFSGYPQRVCL